MIEINEIFFTIDTSNNGRISLKEFEEFLKTVQDQLVTGYKDLK